MELHINTEGCRKFFLSGNKDKYNYYANQMCGRLIKLHILKPLQMVVFLVHCNSKSYNFSLLLVLCMRGDVI